MKFVLTGLVGCLLLAYPFVVFFGLSVFSLNFLGTFLILLALLRLLLWRPAGKKNAATPILALLLLLAGLHALWSGSPSGLRFYPVAVNGVLLAIFAVSLFQEQTVIERLARITEPQLPQSGVKYTRNVTKIWCGFFFLNGLAALYTARFASMEVWVLYNGAIAYVLMGLLFAGEWIVRIRVRRSSDVESG